MIFEAIQFPNIDPAALTIPSFQMFDSTWGPFHLRWYALAYIAGLVLGWRWMVYLIRKDRLWAPNKPAMTEGQTDDFLFWATLGVILGGRIGYILFYKPDMIWKNFWSVFQIWEGGMAFHGGLIGVIIAAIWFTSKPRLDPRMQQDLMKAKAVAEPPAKARDAYEEVKPLGFVKKTDIEKAKKESTLPITLLGLGDLAAAATPIGLFFGRVANFINGELWGRPTDAPWGMIFCNEHIIDTNGGYCPAGDEARHPSQLYEAALEGVALFAIINLLTLRFDSLKRPGLNSGVFLVCYGIFRLLLEFVREPDLHMPEALRGFVTMGMLLSLPMIAIGTWLVRRALKANPLKLKAKAA